MSFKQNVEQHLQHFAQSIGLGELKLNEHDACGLCFDDTLIVNMEYLEDDEAMNLQHHSMQGAFLSLNHDKTEVLLIRSVQASCDYGLFESTLEKFVNTLEWCVSELDKSKQDQPPTPATPPPRPQGGPGGPGDLGMMAYKKGSRNPSLLSGFLVGIFFQSLFQLNPIRPKRFLTGNSCILPICNSTEELYSVASGKQAS